MEHVPLSNFAAYIVQECTFTDGAAEVLYYRVAGELADGPTLPSVLVRADEFAKLDWLPAKWGSRPVILPVARAKEHVRTAMQLLSAPVRSFMYKHTGWVKVGAGWYYLSNGGAIGAEGCVEHVKIQLTHPALMRVDLPRPAQPSAEQLIEVLSLRDLGPEYVTLPLLAATFLAPLGPVVSLDFSLFLGFLTGTYKSATAAVFQAAYGREFTGKTLTSWDGTGSALQALTHRAKDCITVVDDYLPDGGASDAHAKQRDAERLLRSQANKSGRNRMGTDRDLAPVYVPRGLIVNTGEGLPAMRSLRARMITLELQPGDIHLGRLSEAQRTAAAGHLTVVMADYVQYLAARIDGMKERMRRAREELRNRYARPEQHPQTASHVAALHLGLLILQEYFDERGLRYMLSTAQIEKTLQYVADQQRGFLERE